MKLRSVTYLSKEGVKNLWANRLMTIASVGVLTACMVLIGLAILISLNLNQALGDLQQQNVIRAFFNDKTSMIYGNASEDYVPKTETSSETTSSEETDEVVNPNDIPEDAYYIHNEEEALELCEKLKKIDNVLEVEYVSAEDALKSVQENGQIPEGTAEYFQFDDEYGNPLSCGAVITLEDMSKFKQTLKEIQNTKGVDAVQSQSDLAEKLDA